VAPIRRQIIDGGRVYLNAFFAVETISVDVINAV
jgi:hypothetical protein